MSDPISTVTAAHADRLAVLLDALGDPPMSLPELASLAIVAAQPLSTVENLAAVIRRGRAVSTQGIRRYAELVLLARCCDHDPGEACECAEQVAADVAALDAAGLLAGTSADRRGAS